MAQVNPPAESIGKGRGTQLLLGATQFTEFCICVSGVSVSIFVVQA